jgi:peptidoglycan/LPS O-acetylase OafA/YrhL
LPHPLDPWLMRLHGLATMAALFAFGVLAAGHVPHGWRLTAARRGRMQRRLGLGLLVLGGLLVISGYLLYYFIPEWARPATGWLHSALGVLMAGLLVWHRRHRLLRH